MKPIFYSLLLFLIVPIVSGFAQRNSRQFEVSGTVTNKLTGEKLPFVQVALFEPNKDQPVVFSDTDEAGRFALSSPSGDYLLRFFLIGYESKEVQLPLFANSSLGTIEIIEENQNLEEVIVTSTKFPMRADVEGLTINPDQNLSNLGGSLLDILRNTPSVNVGDDGSITLRGSSGTNILINGRNSSLTQNLDQIPASAVAQIKIINNPNARYDAEAEAGVINIVLKKGQDLGTHASSELTYGTRGRMNTGLNLNHRTLRYNMYGGYNFRRWRDIGVRRTTREIFEDGEKLQQETNSIGENTGHNVNFGGDYYFGRNIISYEGVFQTSDDSQLNTLFADLRRVSDDSQVLKYVRRNDETEADDGLDNAVIYERTFDNPKKQLRFSASHSYRNQFKTQNIDIYRNATEALPENLNGQERAFTDEKRYISVFQGDYVVPLENGGTFETGLKSNIRKFDNDYLYSRFQETSQDFVEDPAVSNRFIYKDQIHAAYLIYAKSFNKVDLSAGVRGEYTLVDTYLENTQESNQQEYVNFFPSFQGLYNFSPTQSFKVTYSRRIDRPTAWRLNPFPDITDSLSVRRGNPNLQPEMIHSLEVGHMANYEKGSLTSNLFYRHVAGQLDFVTIVENGISYSQPANLNTSESYGAEFIGLLEVLPWWNVSGSATAFRIKVDGSNVGEEFVNDGFAWNSKLTSDFSLPYGVRMQFVGNYESAEIEAQGRDLSQYYMDISFQRSFFERKGSLSVSIRDVFDTRRFAGSALTNTFSQEFYSKRETRILLVSARYQF
nr:TonB-dependent receptor [Cytophagales bacterium]